MEPPVGIRGGGSGSGFGISPPLTLVDAVSDSQQVEAASPISSRPPASSSYDELIRLSSSAQIDDAALVGDDADRSGGGSSGNRWPRQETLALLRIRSDMDSTFRDATLKGPLWDEVSRKLAELGYNRSAKKCKEKFENVQKYYKRTKEGRGGRQDGKTYKFFTELEALHKATVPTAATTVVTTSFSSPPIYGISNPTPISSVKILPTSTVSSQTPMGMFSPGEHFPARPPPPPIATATGVSFSSNTSSASTEDDNDNDEEMGFGVDLEGEPLSRRKRRRGEGSGSRSSDKMMEFFEGLMKQVMHKQEVMQQKFLEAIEKREEERMIREEALKMEEMGRLKLEQERISQERTISASRDAAIIDFLQKFTGQTIELQTPPQKQQQFHEPEPEPEPMARPPGPVSVSVAAPLSPVPSQPVTIQTEIPLDSEPSSSRWPKPEVLALIKLRGGLESRYQEMNPKGPLWEEISAGMKQMGYIRNPKRCKEKWENINKYFKKVKDSNKKRRLDSKTCPYFDELDALYRKKILGGAGGGSDGGGSGSRSSFDGPIPIIPQSQTTNLFGEGTDDQEQPTTSTKPEGIVNELMELQDVYGRPGSNNVDRYEDEDEDDDYYSEDDDEDDDDDRKNKKMDYKIEFQTQNGTKSEFQSMAVVQ